MARIQKTRTDVIPAPKEDRIAYAGRIGFKIVALIGLMAGGARLSIPLQPVPLTFQVFFVLLGGAWLGPGPALAGQIAYLALGCMGVPLFAFGPGGFWYIMGPTGGYLIGFAAASWLTGAALHSAGMGGTRVGKMAALTAGIIVIHAFGTMHLSIVTGMGITSAIKIGSLPFLPFDLLKAVMALMIIERFNLVPDAQGNHGG
ncbi:MAG TPA: biotin transporter BioY [Candidatus Brocadiia bacterium]|nr:biotin transporter BioY [Candidatus Brocadiia bacterium]